MLPNPVTVIAPPLLKIGPMTDPVMVWIDGIQAACTAPGAPSAESTMRQATGRRPARERAPPSAGPLERRNPPRARLRARSQLTNALMTFLPTCELLSSANVIAHEVITGTQWPVLTIFLGRDARSMAPGRAQPFP